MNKYIALLYKNDYAVCAPKNEKASMLCFLYVINLGVLYREYIIIVIFLTADTCTCKIFFCDRSKSK